MNKSYKSNQQENEAEIRELVEKWALAVRDEDMKGALAHRAKDILMFDIPAPTQPKGIAAYKKTWESYFSWSQKSGVFDISELDITTSDSVAFCHGIVRCAGEKADGEKVEFRFRLTMCFRKVDGEWVVTHEHRSA